MIPADSPHVESGQMPCIAHGAGLLLLLQLRNQLLVVVAVAQRVKVGVLGHVSGVFPAGFHRLLQQLDGAPGILVLLVRVLATAKN